MYLSERQKVGAGVRRPFLGERCTDQSALLTLTPALVVLFAAPSARPTGS